MDTKTKSKYLITWPVLMSVIVPGWGQLYKKHWWRAAAMLLCFGIYLWLSFSGIFGDNSLFLSFAHFGLVAWSVYDAYKAQNDWQ